MRSVAKIRLARAVVCVAVVGGVLVGPVAGASASDKSIKSVIRSYESKVIVAEGHVVTAIGEYKKSGDPSGVKTAITASIGVLRSLKSAVGTQTASSPKVKLGKTKFEKGLLGVIVAYQHLKTAFGEKQASPQAAKAQARRALTLLKQAKKQLREGVRLLR